MGTHPDSAPFRVQKGIPSRGMLYVSDTPSTLSADIIEALMGFHIGDTAAPGLSALQRIHLLGKCTDLNSLARTLSTIKTHASHTKYVPPHVTPLPQRDSGYMSSQSISFGGALTLSSAPFIEQTPHP